MKKNKKFEDWLKEQVESNQELPPEQLWQGISDALDTEEVWQGVEKDLDVDKLWTKIDHRLAQQEQILWWEKTNYLMSGIVALMLLLAPIAINWYATSYPPQTLASKELEPVETPSSKVTADKPKEEPESQYQPGIVAEKNIPKDPAATSLETARAKPITPEPIKAPNIPVVAEEQSEIETAMPSREELQPFRSLSFWPSELVLAGAQPFSLPKLEVVPVLAEDTTAPEKDKQIAGQWQVGIGGAARMAWLLNDKTYRGFEETSLTNSLPAFRKSFSINLERSLSPSFSIVADAALLQEAGQRYEEYEGGIYGETDIRLRYSNVSLLLAFAPAQLNTRSVSKRRLLFGFSGGYLNQATLVRPDYEQDVTQQYRKGTTSFILGLEVVRPLLPRLWVAYGLRGHLDLVNAYAGDDMVPANFRDTKNASLDLSISIKYDIKKN